MYIPKPLAPVPCVEQTGPTNRYGAIICSHVDEYDSGFDFTMNGIADDVEVVQTAKSAMQWQADSGRVRSYMMRQTV